MDPLQLLILLAIAGICGAFAELLVAFDTRGMVTVLVSIVVGIVGIFLGRAISDAIGLQTVVVRVGTQRVDLLWTIAGAALVLLVLKLLRSGGRTLLGRRAS
ncbi:MAG TPA: GlsB/YeaQ/YmgE family stress response membrane protein [Roseiflexaceae bacterium]|nr:GlsB/YeaQ/YmgE family stress response membrane protein [Roseiflexaceae bacterium]